MASGRMEFHARTIMQHANYSFVLPNDVEMGEVFDKDYYKRGPKNIILLHGLTGTDTDWLYGGVAQEMAIQYNLNVFMPTTANSFYLNRGYEGANFTDFIAEELPEYIKGTFGIEMDSSNSLIGGLSMGGYGAIHIALAYPDRFGSCIALSSALNQKELADPMMRGRNTIMSKAMLDEIFGDPDKLLESDMNPEFQYRQLADSGKKIPRIYIACGTEDSLIESNREFRDFLESEDADFIYEEGEGGHNWTFWNKYLKRGLDALPDLKK